MPRTKNFDDLRDAARRDPERARRIDEAKLRAVEEIGSYRLAELRRSLGVTQVELAEMIGKSQSAVSQLEHGEIGLSPRGAAVHHHPARWRGRDHRYLRRPPHPARDLIF